MDPKLKITRKRITQINKLMPRYRCSFFFTRKQTVRIIVTENYPLIIKFLNLSTTRLAQPLFSLISLSDVRRRILFLFIPRGDERQKQASGENIVDGCISVNDGEQNGKNRTDVGQTEAVEDAEEVAGRRGRFGCELIGEGGRCRLPFPDVVRLFLRGTSFLVRTTVEIFRHPILSLYIFYYFIIIIFHCFHRIFKLHIFA